MTLTETVLCCRFVVGGGGRVWLMFISARCCDRCGGGRLGDELTACAFGRLAYIASSGTTMSTCKHTPSSFCSPLLRVHGLSFSVQNLPWRIWLGCVSGGSLFPCRLVFSFAVLRCWGVGFRFFLSRRRRISYVREVEFFFS